MLVSINGVVELWDEPRWDWNIIALNPEPLMDILRHSASNFIRGPWVGFVGIDKLTVTGNIDVIAYLSSSRSYGYEWLHIPDIASPITLFIF